MGGGAPDGAPQNINNNHRPGPGHHHGAHRRGLRVPQDLAVVGFDNMVESAYFWPALSTINHNLYELGCRAVQETVEQIEAVHCNEKLKPQNILLSPELIVRESSVIRQANFVVTT